MSELEPVDYRRCQARIRKGSSFMTIGKPAWSRCSSRPCVVVREREPGRDGQRGAMSLCEECFGVFREKNPGCSVLPVETDRLTAQGVRLIGPARDLSSSRLRPCEGSLRAEHVPASAGSPERCRLVMELEDGRLMRLVMEPEEARKLLRGASEAWGSKRA